MQSYPLLLDVLRDWLLLDVLIDADVELLLRECDELELLSVLVLLELDSELVLDELLLEDERLLVLLEELDDDKLDRLLDVLNSSIAIWIFTNNSTLTIHSSLVSK